MVYSEKKGFMVENQGKLFSAGLTLIELLVTATILVLLTGGALAAYRSFNDRQILSAAAKETKNNLSMARNWAMTVKKVYCSQTAAGYEVDFSDDGSGYTIKEKCSDNSSSEVQSFSFPGGVTGDYMGSFTFKPLTGELESGSGVEINLSYKGRTQTVTVKASGLIE